MKAGLSDMLTFKGLGFQWQLPTKVFPHCSAEFPHLLVKGSTKNESISQPGMQ